MSLIHCPECNHEVSDKANSCPNCGYPVLDNIHIKKQSNISLDKIIVFVLLGLIIILLAVILIYNVLFENKHQNDINLTENEKELSSNDENLSPDISEETTEVTSDIDGAEKVDVIYWCADDQNIFIQTDDVYITTDSNGNYGVVAKFTIAGAGNGKAEIPLFDVSLYQNGERYSGAYSHNIDTTALVDWEEFYNMAQPGDYLYPPTGEYEGMISSIKVAKFMPIASYDLEDSFQIYATIGPSRVVGVGQVQSIQYMEVDHLEVR